MNIKNYCSEAEGGQAAFAKKIGVSEAQIWQWANDVRIPNPESCLRIEQATEGKVTRQELRPHDFWLIWPDLAHLKPKTTEKPKVEVTATGEASHV